MDKVTVKLINPASDPWTHTELPLLDEQGQPQVDEAGNPLWQQFKAGDVIEVSADTAEHLVMSRQGEILDAKAQPVLDAQGLPGEQPLGPVGV